MTRTTTVGLMLLLGGLATAAQAEELQWRPAGQAAVTEAPASPAAVKIGVGAPIPLGQGEQQDDAHSSNSASVWGGVAAESRPFPSVNYIVRGQAPGGVPNVPPPPMPGVKVGGEEAFNCGVVPGPGTNTAPAQGGGVFGLFSCVTNPTGGRKPFESDHCFDGFCEPVTRSSMFEDPRALTEFRPVLQLQKTHGGDTLTQGGDIETLNLRGSVAFTDWLSFTFDQLGWILIQPHDPAAGSGSRSGFMAVELGPKFTFFRNTACGGFFGQSLAATGLVFEIPVGSAQVFENTGWLSLRPYITYGQEFWPTAFGTFHFIGTAAYSVGIDNNRSDHVYLGLHLDYDVAKLGHYYPFVEMNYFLYTSNGHGLPVNFEGADIANFGATNVSGQSEMSLALGMRYKCNEHVQLGAAFEVGVVGDRSLMDYGVTFDMIFRY